MGRIDEAMRRSGNSATLSPAAGGPAADDTFVSPWTFRDGPSGKPVPVPSARDDRAIAPKPRATASETDTPLSRAEVRPAGSFSDSWMERLVIAPGADAVLVEQFRQLAATLHHAHAENNIRVVMVTSAGAGEGKSLTAINLALTLSDSYGQRVLLIDADLRRPSLHEVVHVPGTTGLGDTLKSSVEQKLPIYRISDTLVLVPAGQPDPDPMLALTSSRMQQILAEASTRFDWVLIDAPPIAPIVDSSLLAANIDAAILVVRAGQAQYADVKRAIESLGRERIIGVVLNAADELETALYRHTYPADPARS